MARSPLTLSAKAIGAQAGHTLRTRQVLLITLGALVAGIGSTVALLGERPPFGSVRIGSWQTFPRMGSAEVDPYGRAILARGPHLPLAAGEGILLGAHVDDNGDALTGRCRYAITGSTLPSRGWTLAVVDRSDRALTGPDAAVIGDADLILTESGQISITASPTIMAGNWLRLPAGERFGLAMRFYDSPMAASLGQLDANVLPRITRLGCKT